MAFKERITLGDLLKTKWYKYAVERTGVAMPNCFTYACARISEIVGRNVPLDDVKVRGAGDLWEGHSKDFTCQKYAREGALMIWKGGNGNFGHVAVCERLVDKNTIGWSESNYGMNMFGYIERNPNGYAELQFMGYLYHKDLPVVEAPKPAPAQSNEVLNTIPSDFVHEHATFYCNVDKINIRRAPTTKGKLTGDWYENGMSVNYDGYVRREGYVWISWISGKTGNRHWMAAGELNEKGINVKPYGKFR